MKFIPAFLPPGRAGTISGIVTVFCIAPAVFFLSSCAKPEVSSGSGTVTVKTAFAARKTVPDTVSGFGPLSFVAKVDITAPQDGTIKHIYRREGDGISAGSAAVQLDNPRINLVVRRTEDDFSQAAAALRLARARLTEGEYAAEAGLLTLARTEAELAEGRRNLEEERRKQSDAEKLFAAGGLSEEAIRESRFKFQGAEEQIRLMEQEVEIRKVGLRDRDIAAAGLVPPDGFPSPEERKSALIHLATLTLRAEAEAAEARLEAAGRELESARLALSELAVASPASGIIGARYTEEGERIKRDDKLLTVIDTGSLYAVFTLRETDALRLKKGMAAEVRVDGTGRGYKGIVDLINPQADSQSFTFSARVVIPSAEGLKPGMFARVTVYAGEGKNCVVVPDRAVVNKRNNEGTVFVTANGTVSERTVTFGETLNGEEVEITSGIMADEAVIVNPGTALKEGTHVIPE